MAMVKAGSSRDSYLFKKINNALDEGAMLSGDEGGLMPFYSAPLEDYEIELVRQWIAAGVPETGESFSYDIIKEYYEEGGLSNVEALEPPAEGEGFQIYFEPVFLEPGGETEYFNKFQFDLPTDLEVVGLEATMDDFSHHLIFYKYADDFNTTMDYGRRYLASSLFGNLNILADIFINSVPVGTWQYNLNHKLPEGTAYFWDKDAVFDLNYHVKNYSQTQVMSAGAYLNIYTQPVGVAEVEMQAGLLTYGEENPLALSILNNGHDTTYVMEQYYDVDDTMHVWLLQSHTHQLGIDFDMYLRNEDGTLGEQIYEGMRDPEHNYDIGFYDYAHPPVLTFDDELLPVPLKHGLTHIASFNNSGDETVGFGLTTNDEMFITYFHYTLDPLPASEPTSNTPDLTELDNFNISPNPFTESTNITYDLEKPSEVTIKVFNVLGELVETVSNQRQAEGTHEFNIQTNWQAGVYFVQLTANGKNTTKEVVKMK